MMQNPAQIDLFLTLGQIVPYTQQIAAPDKLIDGTDPKLRHNFTQFLRDKFHKVYDIFRFSVKTGAQLWILRCNACRTGIQVADTHHDAAHRYQRRGCKSKLFGSKQRRDRHIASGHQLTVCLNPHFITKAV